MRERGLKYVHYTDEMREKASLPMRERGLKYNGGRGQLSKPLSLPMRGAWIEIVNGLTSSPRISVAPHAGGVD